MANVFRKGLPKRCAYCSRGVALGSQKVACKTNGVVAASGSCRRFSYDPLKRMPPKPVKLASDYKPEDFSL